jgi:hypothetical protein
LVVALCGCGSQPKLPTRSGAARSAAYRMRVIWGKNGMLAMRQRPFGAFDNVIV